MAGSKGVYAKWVGTALVYYTAAGLEIFRIDGTLRGLSLPAGSALIGEPVNLRARFTAAQVNAGASIVAAVAGYKPRMIASKALAYGGAAGAVTTVDILGTQAASVVKLVAYAQASLTQSTVLTDGGSGAAVLADGASYAQNDVNTALTIGKTGASLTTATGIDVILTYALEA